MDDLKNTCLEDASLEKEWMITIQTPVQGLERLLEALRKSLDLKQGHYDCCLQVTGPGEQQFRALAGSHAGAEHTLQSVTVVDVTISIAPDELLLKRAFSVIFENHVHEDPTIRVSECWGSRSKYSGDKNNPNKYWNRPDAAEVHGRTVSQHRSK